MKVLKVLIACEESQAIANQYSEYILQKEISK
jgi:hypothetical protein